MFTKIIRSSLLCIYLSLSFFIGTSCEDDLSDTPSAVAGNNEWRNTDTHAISNSGINKSLELAAKDLMAAVTNKQITLSAAMNHQKIRLSDSKTNYPEIIQYMDHQYVIGLTIFNPETCDFNLTPVIATGTDTVINNNQQESLIPAWRLNQGHTWEYFPLSEQEAKKLKCPLLITNLYSDTVTDQNPYLNNQNLNSGKSLGQEKATNTVFDLYVTGEKITQKFEDDGNAEYNIAWAIQYGTSFYEFSWEHIKDIDIRGRKNELNKDLRYQKKLYSLDYSFVPPGKNYTFTSGEVFNIIGVTYEHDWYASIKTTSVNGINVPFRAKYSHEYYQKIYLTKPANQHGISSTITGNGYVKISHNTSY